MPVVTRLQPIQDWIEVVVDEDLSPQAQSTAVAGFAREQLSEAQVANDRALGRRVPHKTFVDGRAEAPLESVKPKGGRIVFEFELVGDVLRAIAQMLVDRSPIRKGDYILGHRLFADGTEIAVGAEDSVPFAYEYVFTNLVPYARKIEIGRTKAGRPFVIQVENRIYERTARDAKPRFGNIVKINFSYRATIAGGTHRTARAPAIVVRTR